MCLSPLFLIGFSVFLCKWSLRSYNGRVSAICSKVSTDRDCVNYQQIEARLINRSSSIFAGVFNKNKHKALSFCDRTTLDTMLKDISEECVIFGLSLDVRENLNRKYQDVKVNIDKATSTRVMWLL